MIRSHRTSLSAELQLLVQALTALHRLLPPEDGGRVGDVAAALAFLVERVRLLERAVRGQVDPALLHCAENAAIEPPSGDEPPLDERDVVLTSWTAKERRLHAKLVLLRERRARKFASASSLGRRARQTRP